MSRCLETPTEKRKMILSYCLIWLKMELHEEKNEEVIGGLNMKDQLIKYVTSLCNKYNQNLNHNFLKIRTIN